MLIIGENWKNRFQHQKNNVWAVHRELFQSTKYKLIEFDCEQRQLINRVSKSQNWQTEALAIAIWFSATILVTTKPHNAQYMLYTLLYAHTLHRSKMKNAECVLSGYSILTFYLKYICNLLCQALSCLLPSETEIVESRWKWLIIYSLDFGEFKKLGCFNPWGWNRLPDVFGFLLFK